MGKPLLILGLCALALVLAFTPHVFPFTTDSVIYISTARHILDGEGIVFTNAFVEPADQETLPLSIQPPGYSLMIAFAGLLGLDVYPAALVVTCLFYALLPFGFYLVLGCLMPRKPALVIAGVCTFLFANLRCALMAWSDVPFLFLSLMVFSFTFRAIGTSGRRQLFNAFLAGLFVGLCLVTRNVGYAVLAAALTGLCLAAVVRLVSWKELARTLLVFTAAFFLPMLPYLVRNYVVLGRLSAFRYPPSNHPLAVNLLDYAHGLGGMIFANPGSYGLLGILAAGMIVWFLRSAVRSFKTDTTKIVCASVLILYFLGGSFMLVLARTLFFMPEPINERYLIQYAWPLVAGLSYSVFVGLSRLRERGLPDTRGAVVLLLMVYAVVQALSAVDLIAQQKRVLKIARTVESRVPVLARVPADHVIVSNVMDMTAVFSRREVRLLNGYLPYGLTQLLGPERDFSVFLIKERNEDFRSYLYPLSWLNPQGYRRVYEDRDVVLWSLATEGSVEASE